MLPVKLRHLGRSRRDHGEQRRELAIDGSSAGASRENRAGHADRRIDGENPVAPTRSSQLKYVTASISGGPGDGVGMSRRRTIASVHGAASTSGT